MLQNIINGLITKFLENPIEWTAFWALCGINLSTMILYILSHNKKWVIISFGGILTAIWIMLYLIMKQNI